jgi:hypothetical protein
MPWLIEVENHDEFVRDLRKLDKETKQVVKTYNKKVSEEAAQFAPGFTPKETGRLARSTKGMADAKGAYVKSGPGGSKGGYGPVIHWGWGKRGIRPNPYILRSFAKVGALHGGDIANYYLEGLMKALEGFETTKGT